MGQTSDYSLPCPSGHTLLHSNGEVLAFLTIFGNHEGHAPDNLWHLGTIHVSIPQVVREEIADKQTNVQTIYIKAVNDNYTNSYYIYPQDLLWRQQDFGELIHGYFLPFNRLYLKHKFVFRSTTNIIRRQEATIVASCGSPVWLRSRNRCFAHVEKFRVHTIFVRVFS